jgi:hypothetical protein
MTVRLACPSGYFSGPACECINSLITPIGVRVAPRRRKNGFGAEMFVSAPKPFSA